MCLLSRCVLKSLGQDWSSLNREVIEETGNLGTIMAWHRSGGIESRNHQIMNW